MIRLEKLSPQHADPILDGQDDLLAAEVFGVHWEADALSAFLDRASRWQADGPLREYAAMDDGAGAIGGAGTGAGVGAAGESATCGARGTGGELIGGGGLHLLGAGLERGQAALTYWVLAPHRGQGYGTEIATALVDLARTEQRVHQLMLRIAPHNAASAAVASSLGATPTGTTERHPADGTRFVARWTLPLG